MGAFGDLLRVYWGDPDNRVEMTPGERERQRVEKEWFRIFEAQKAAFQNLSWHIREKHFDDPYFPNFGEWQEITNNGEHDYIDLKIKD